jgi:hypothetical protein
MFVVYGIWGKTGYSIFKGDLKAKERPSANNTFS